MVLNLKFINKCLDQQVNQIKKMYEKFKLEFELFSFSDDMSKYYKLTDLAITRSGASSLQN